jgi:hypothetical protein
MTIAGSWEMYVQVCIRERIDSSRWQKGLKFLSSFYADGGITNGVELRFSKLSLHYDVEDPQINNT